MATKFNPEIAQLIVERLKANPSLYSAAAAADITYPTLMRWIEKGEAGDEAYEAFALEVQSARRMMKDEIVQSLYEIATDRLHPAAVKAAKEILSCLYPREFSSVRHVVQHTAEPDIELDVEHMETGELRQLRRLIAKAAAGPPNPARLPPPSTVVDVLEAKAGHKISKISDAN